MATMLHEQKKQKDKQLKIYMESDEQIGKKENKERLKAWIDNGSISMVSCICHLIAFWSPNKENPVRKWKIYGTSKHTPPWLKRFKETLCVRFSKNLDGSENNRENHWHVCQGHY